jgi:hypothetical protein
MTDETLIRVECHAGGRVDETPRRLVFADRTVEVAEEEARWREPDGDRFRLRGDDDVLYTVAHLSNTGIWLLLGAARPG